MSPTKPYRRSPGLMSAADTALLVVDVQEKLVPVVANHAAVVWNCRRLIDAARLLRLPVVATEQVPENLGPTVSELRQRLDHVFSKQTFSGGCCAALEDLQGRGIEKLLLCGVEAHVCVQQTALDLLADGWWVYVAVDAVASRFEIDYRTALQRMDSAGVTLTTTEAVLFEWCQRADTAEFSRIRQLLQEPCP